MTRILGIDLGTKRLGLALGDPITGIAVPLDVLEIENTDPVKVVWGMVQQDGYDHIVIGEARTADGEPTPMSERAEAFAKNVEQVTGVPVTLVNEHLTSKVSDMLAEEAGKGMHDDALAAMLIVQEFLNEQ